MFQNIKYELDNVIVTIHRPKQEDLAVDRSNEEWGDRLVEENSAGFFRWVVVLGLDFISNCTS